MPDTIAPVNTRPTHLVHQSPMRHSSPGGQEARPQVLQGATARPSGDLWGAAANVATTLTVGGVVMGTAFYTLPWALAPFVFYQGPFTALAAGKQASENVRCPAAPGTDVAASVVDAAFIGSLVSGTLGAAFALTGVLSFAMVPPVAAALVGFGAVAGGLCALWLPVSTKREAVASLDPRQDAPLAELTAARRTPSPHIQAPLPVHAPTPIPLLVRESRVELAAPIAEVAPAQQVRTPQTASQMDEVLRVWEIQQHSAGNVEAHRAVAKIKAAYLSQATTLDLSKCRLSCLPETQEAYQNVQYIVLANVGLQVLPEVLCASTQMKRVDLRGNPGIGHMAVLIDDVSFINGFDDMRGTVTKSDNFVCGPRFVNGWLQCDDGHVIEEGFSEERGRYVLGKLSGQGTYTEGERVDNYGYTFIGSWENGLPDGPGKVVMSSGLTVVGTWRQGEPVGEMNIASTDGRIYQGTFRGGQCDFLRQYHNDDSDAGSVSYDNLSAKIEVDLSQGVCTWPGGTRDEGTFYEGFLHKGTRTYPDGTVDGGVFLDNKPAGTGWRKLSGTTKQIAGAFQDGHFRRRNMFGALVDA